MVANAIEKQQHTPVRDVIQNEVALTARGQNALILQDSELLADDGLAGAGRFDDLADRSGSALMLQVIEDPQPKRMRRVPDNGSDSLQRLHVDQRISGSDTHLAIPPVLQYSHTPILY